MPNISTKGWISHLSACSGCRNGSKSCLGLCFHDLILVDLELVFPNAFHLLQLFNFEKESIWLLGRTKAFNSCGYDRSCAVWCDRSCISAAQIWICVALRNRNMKGSREDRWDRWRVVRSFFFLKTHRLDLAARPAVGGNTPVHEAVMQQLGDIWACQLVQEWGIHNSRFSPATSGAFNVFQLISSTFNLYHNCEWMVWSQWNIYQMYIGYQGYF